MSEVKPPTSASLREARALRVKPCPSSHFKANDTWFALDCDLCIAAAFDSSRRAALGQAAEIVQTYLAFDSQRAVSWHEVQDCRAAIRALMEGE